MCSCVWIRFFLFLSDMKGGNAPSVVTSGHFPLRISLLYHLSPFFHFNELQAFETRDEIASAHVALWLPRMENDSSLSCCRCIFHRDRLIASVQICAGIKIAPASPDWQASEFISALSKVSMKRCPLGRNANLMLRDNKGHKSKRRRTQTTPDSCQQTVLWKLVSF